MAAQVTDQEVQKVGQSPINSGLLLPDTNSPTVIYFLPNHPLMWNRSIFLTVPQVGYKNSSSKDNKVVNSDPSIVIPK